MRIVGLPTLTCVVLALFAIPAQAAFPGVPGPIAYSQASLSEIEDSGGIFSHGPRRQDAPRRLTESLGDASPSYSASGQLIVFVGNHDPGLAPRGSHIYVMRRDGSDLRQLTSGDFYDSNPSFSPDGRLVVFDRSGFDERTTHVFGVSVANGALRQITSGAGDDSDPTYTPDGKRIIFVSNRRSSGRTDRSNIFSMRPDGSRVRLLVGGPRNELDPDVSPDGRKIAFSSNRDHGPNLFVARMSGRHVVQLTRSRYDCFRSACYTNPSWSPDGAHIAFLSTSRYDSSLEVMRADGRGFAKEFDSGGTEEEGYGSRVGAPGWGPRP
jgi:TolB protein